MKPEGKKIQSIPLKPEAPAGRGKPNNDTALQEEGLDSLLTLRGGNQTKERKRGKGERSSHQG